MKLKFIAATTLVALFATQTANALVHQRGVVTSVDTSTKTFVLTNKHGRSQQFQLTDTAVVYIDGKKHGIGALAPNQKVSIAIPSAPADHVKARILKVDLESGIAVIKPLGSTKTMSIRLTKDTKVSGKISSITQLAEGQLIEARYVAKAQ